MVRYGCQTPSQSVILDYNKSLGQEAIDIYKKTGLSPYPWQEKLTRDIFALNDDGLWTHSKFAYAIPRRNGKTEAVYISDIDYRRPRVQVLAYSNPVLDTLLRLEKRDEEIIKYAILNERIF